MSKANILLALLIGLAIYADGLYAQETPAPPDDTQLIDPRLNEIQNNVPLVFTPEGLSFAHTGDQSNGGRDFDWIDQVGKHHRVDVFLPNCWTTDIVRTIRGFDPALVITGHENEMGHTIDHREPYWLTYQRKTGSDRFGGSRLVGYTQPLVLMTWGESFHYKRRREK